MEEGPERKMFGHRLSEIEGVLVDGVWHRPVSRLAVHDHGRYIRFTASINGREADVTAPLGNVTAVTTVARRPAPRRRRATADKAKGRTIPIRRGTGRR
ncbi:MAG: hypothetical protein S0880_18600 [Actinomycetota bacterium]|nr:hypothetical protein [Actinomycetota bacterium]